MIGKDGTNGGRAEPARIDPRKIPAEDYATGCRVLAASIRRALADPDTRADFERWKQERRQAG